VGCGSTETVVKPIEKTPSVVSRFHLDPIEDHTGQSIPKHFVGELNDYLESDLTKQKLLAAESDPAPRVHIELTSYRMRSGFNRAFFGVMAGKDGIESKVTVLDGATGRVLGESNVSSFNASAIGNDDDVARMHAEEITKFLAGEKK
jgi:hypothetical protein